MRRAEKLPLLRVLMIARFTSAIVLSSLIGSLLGLWASWPELALCAALSLGPVATFPKRFAITPLLIAASLAGGATLGSLGISPLLGAAALVGGVVAYEAKAPIAQILQGACLSMIGTGIALILLAPSHGVGGWQGSLPLWIALGAGASLGLAPRWLPLRRESLPSRLWILWTLEGEGRRTALEGRDLCRRMMRMEPTLRDEFVSVATWLVTTLKHRQDIARALQADGSDKSAEITDPHLALELARLREERAASRRQEMEFARDIDHALCTLRITYARLTLPSRPDDPGRRLEDVLPALRKSPTERAALRRTQAELAAL
ncbi:MAG: hypothetical protein EA397_10585 [Deltaproteobacteria bacterium]|nr:MAG: hypothetical protein EA397_10585 [Deltaproteobacteria bacterium]